MTKINEALRMDFEKLAKTHDLNLEPSIHEPENYASSMTNNYWWFYQDVIESQKAALSDNESVANTLPDGWVAVPVEPTPKMVDATFNDAIETNGASESHNRRNKRIYKAMLQAAPSCEKEKG